MVYSNGVEEPMEEPAPEPEPEPEPEPKAEEIKPEVDEKVLEEMEEKAPSPVPVESPPNTQEPPKVRMITSQQSSSCCCTRGNTSSLNPKCNVRVKLKLVDDRSLKEKKIFFLLICKTREKILNFVMLRCIEQDHLESTKVHQLISQYGCWP